MYDQSSAITAADPTAHTEIGKIFDQIAAERSGWIDKNAYFYEEDTRYMRFLVAPGLRVLEIGCGIGQLLAELQPAYGVGIDISPAMIGEAQRRYPDLNFHIGDVEDPTTVSGLNETFDVVVISDTIGTIRDCEQLLNNVAAVCTPETRVIIAYYSPYWEPALRAAEHFGLKMPQPQQNWLTTSDIAALLELTDYQLIKREWRVLVPRRLFGIGRLINRLIAPFPLIRRLCLRNYLVARPLRKADDHAEPTNPSTTVLVPCRNERGNVEAAILRTPKFCDDIEFLFAEGGSSDGTYEEIERVIAKYPDLDIKVIRQQGKGKGNAVREGFAAARGDILMILDGDLTMPPEDLPKFYKALRDGKGEFINGSRLVYPMQQDAMRFLNEVANHLFSIVFTWLLNQRFTDTLCGTKALSRAHYEQIAANRGFFGDFDPFGDFDLIFGAAKLNLKVVEIPVRYAARVYGETQISRFRHGLLLFRMVGFAFRKMKAL
jgi:SAM-dependent methyltransferase